MSISELIFLLIALMVCITLHEASHAWVASRLGDQTAKMQGRVSLNPLNHLDPLGTLMIFLVHFGWGKPVQFDYRNLKYPRRDAALISLSGPLANLITALVVGTILNHASLPLLVSEMLWWIYSLSITLCLFNLLPIPPLDGSKLLGLLIPKSKEAWYWHYMSQGPIYLILFVIGDRLIDYLFGFSIFAAYFSVASDFITTLIGLSA